MNETTTALIQTLGSIVCAALAAVASILSAKGQRPSTPMEGEDFKIRYLLDDGKNGNIKLRVVAITFAIFSILIVSNLYWRLNALEKSSIAVISGEEFLKDAEQDNRPYIIEAVLSNVEIEDSKRENWKVRKAYVKTTYVLRMLVDVREGFYEKKGIKRLAFVEDYGTNQEKRFKWWLGTERQEPVSTERNTFNVYFSAKKGDMYTLVTGGVYTYSLPLQPQRLTPDLQPLPENEDYYMYKNTEDYVKSLTIVVHSKTTKLSVPRRAGFRIEGDQPIRVDTFQPSDDRPISNDQASISCKFSNLRPGTHGGFRYTW